MSTTTRRIASCGPTWVKTRKGSFARTPTANVLWPSKEPAKRTARRDGQPGEVTRVSPVAASAWPGWCPGSPVPVPHLGRSRTRRDSVRRPEPAASHWHAWSLRPRERVASAFVFFLVDLAAGEPLVEGPARAVARRRGLRPPTCEDDDEGD